MPSGSSDVFVAVLDSSGGAGKISVDTVNRRVGVAFQFIGQVLFAGTSLLGPQPTGAYVITTLDP